MVVEVKPHEQLVVKVNWNRRLTLRNRRFVREQDPGKTSLEDQPLEPNTKPHPVHVTGKRMSQTPTAKTPITWKLQPAPPTTQSY